MITKCTVPGTAAITFDDGPYIWDQELLDQLAAAGMKATFFLNGNHWGCIFDYAAIVKKMVAAGHQVASHTWSHRNIPDLTNNQLNYQIRRLEDSLMKILGYAPRYMRPPYGAMTDARLAQLSKLGQRVIHWDSSSEDANGYSVEQSKTALTRDINNGGTIILNHNVKETTVKQLVPWFIKTFGKKYKWVTVAECLGDKEPYAKVPTLDASNTCAAPDGSLNDGQ
ncbi:chitin deacetylase-like protein [Gaertneriomyces semiglobifer]|nr:chitin deacetylase-like protein [Gaertneriomyces semiglobifer]